jgi:hypothetical protein
MRQYFELGRNEKHQDWLLLTFAVFCCLTIAAGVYFQLRQIDHNNFFIPLFYFLASCFLLTYCFNALNQGHLIEKWTPSYIYKSFSFLTVKFFPSADKAVTRLLGIVSLAIALGLFVKAIIIISKA